MGGNTDYLGHNACAPSMKCAEVRVLNDQQLVALLWGCWGETHLKESDQVTLKGVVHSFNSNGREAEVRFVILTDLPNEPVHGRAPDEKVRRLLIFSDFPECDCARPVAVRLPHTT